MRARPADLKRGAFILVACGFAAAWSNVFLGGNFGTIFDGVRAAPLSASLSFYVWAICAAAGGVWLWLGIRAGVPLPNIPAALWSVGVIALCLNALWRGWVLPARAWGLWLSLASRGLWLALMARGVAGVWVALWGFVPGVRLTERHPMPKRCGHEIELAEYRDVLANYVERDESNRAALTEVESLIAHSGVRKAVLAAWFPDHGTTEAEKRLRTEKFQSASALFARLGVKG